MNKAISPWLTRTEIILIVALIIPMLCLVAFSWSYHKREFEERVRKEQMERIPVFEIGAVGIIFVSPSLMGGASLLPWLYLAAIVVSITSVYLMYQLRGFPLMRLPLAIIALGEVIFASIGFVRYLIG